MDKIKVETSYHADGGVGKIKYIISPSVKEIVDKINELVDYANKNRTDERKRN